MSRQCTLVKLKYNSRSWAKPKNPMEGPTVGHCVVESEGDREPLGIEADDIIPGFAGSTVKVVGVQFEQIARTSGLSVQNHPNH